MVQQIKRAILYVRVSTDDQADKGYSLPTQLEACRNYATRQGFTIEAEFQEDCSGAIPFSERPEGRKALLMIKEHKAEALIAYQVDRLSRDIVDLLTNVRSWIKNGIQVHACDIGQVESELDIVLVIKGWQGSDERKKIAERTKRGRLGKAKSGKVVGMGFAPYGYRFAIDSNGKSVGLVVNEREAEIVRMIFHWFTIGDDTKKGMAERTIARRLSEMGIPTPSAGRTKGKKSKSGIWSPATVHRLLKNETYSGTWRFGKRMGAKGEVRRPLEETIQVQVPPIISRQTWDATEKTLLANKQNAIRNGKHPFLLRSMVKCNCGGTLVGRFDTRRGSHEYRCGLRMVRFSKLDPNRCVEKPVRGDRLEYYVWEYIREVIVNAENFEEELKRAQEAETESLAPKQHELENLEELIQDSDERATKLATAWASAPEGVVKKSLYTDIQRFEELYQKQLKRKEELEVQLTERHFTDADIQAARHFRQDLLLGLENPTFDDIRRTLELLQVSVKVHNQIATVICKIPAQTALEPHTIVLNKSKTNFILPMCILPCPHGSKKEDCPALPNGCACSIAKSWHTG